MGRWNRWSRAMRVTFGTLAIVGLLLTAGWLYYRREYPYGWSHSCDKQLIIALMAYAEANGRAFPSGEKTPEASLSLLYPTYVNHYVLQGKTVPLETVERVLASGGRLGPDTCGWHYVEGLTLDDDRELALFWDKVGLGHNGQRRPQGGHLVYLVGGYYIGVSGADWETFLQEQNRLLRKRVEKGQAAEPDADPPGDDAR